MISWDLWMRTKSHWQLLEVTVSVLRSQLLLPSITWTASLVLCASMVVPSTIDTMKLIKSSPNMFRMFTILALRSTQLPMLSRRSTKRFIILNGEALSFKILRPERAIFSGNATWRDSTKIWGDMFPMLHIGANPMVFGLAKLSQFSQQAQSGFTSPQTHFPSITFSPALKDASLPRLTLMAPMISILLLTTGCTRSLLIKFGISHKRCTNG